MQPGAVSFEAAGSGTYAPLGVPAWAALTPYVAGQFVTNGGILYRALTTFTSGATFSAANWAAFEPYVGDSNDLLGVGEETFERAFLSSSVAFTSGQLRLTYFTARKTEVCTQGRVETGTTGATATPSLCRFGWYLEDPVTKDLSLAAAVANDTTLFASPSTWYTRSFSGGNLNKVQGQRYALGVLVVSAAAMPTIGGVNLVTGGSAEAGMAPRVTGLLSSQTDLPPSISAGSILVVGSQHYGAVLP